MASHLLCAGCCFVLLTAALNTVVSELTTLLSSQRSCCGVTFLSRKTQILYVGGKKALKQSQRFKTKRWSMKQLSYYPTDREQSLSMIQCLKKNTKNSDAPVKVIHHILDWHNCVIWHGGLLPANHSWLLAGFLFIHQCWIPEAMMQARTPRVCFCSRAISNF